MNSRQDGISALDVADLVRILDEIIADPGVPGFDIPAKMESLPYPGPPFFNAEGDAILWPVVQKVLQTLRVVDEFAKLDQVHMRISGTETRTLPLAFFAASLVARCTEIGNSAGAVEDLRALIAANKAEALHIGILAGLRVDSITQIQDDIVLVPFSDMPNTRNKLHLEEYAEATRKIFARSSPASALILRYTLPDLFLYGEAPKIPQPGNDHRVLRIRDIADCLMVACNCGAGILAEWDMLASPAAPRVPDSCMSIDPKVSLTDDDFQVVFLDAEKSVDLIQKLDQFNGARDSLRLAMSHLRAARRSRSAEDQAINLGIALEVLLTHDDNTTTEIANRVASRGAWLAGQSSDERMQIAHLIKSLYDQRSQAVHKGVLERKPSINGQKVPFFEFAPHAASLVGDIYQALLMRGEWPNWERLVLDA